MSFHSRHHTESARGRITLAIVNQYLGRRPTNQQFRFDSMGGGYYYRLVARHSVQCLSIAGASSDNGAQIVRYKCRNDNFRFQVST